MSKDTQVPVFLGNILHFWGVDQAEPDDKFMHVNSHVPHVFFDRNTLVQRVIEALEEEFEASDRIQEEARQTLKVSDRFCFVPYEVSKTNPQTVVVTIEEHPFPADSLGATTMVYVVSHADYTDLKHGQVFDKTLLVTSSHVEAEALLDREGLAQYQRLGKTYHGVYRSNFSTRGPNMDRADAVMRRLYPNKPLLSNGDQLLESLHGVGIEVRVHPLKLLAMQAR